MLQSYPFRLAFVVFLVVVHSTAAVVYTTTTADLISVSCTSGPESSDSVPLLPARRAIPTTALPDIPTSIPMMATATIQKGSSGELSTLCPSEDLLLPGSITACGSRKAVIHEGEDNQEETDHARIHFSQCLRACGWPTAGCGAKISRTALGSKQISTQ